MNQHAQQWTLWTRGQPPYSAMRLALLRRSRAATPATDHRPAPAAVDWRRDELVLAALQFALESACGRLTRCQRQLQAQWSGAAHDGRHAPDEPDLD